MLRIATRASDLARWQADHVAELLRTVDSAAQIELVLVETTADRRLDIPIETMGGKGVFVKEIQAAVLDGRADMAVHSGKDLPSVRHPDLTLAAVPERGEPRDALVGSRLDQLRLGAHVATGSARRRVQLCHLRPDLVFFGLRGNMAKRLSQLDEYDAIVVAAVALQRLGMGNSLTEILDVEVMTPQVSQGALAVECLRSNGSLIELLAQIEHGPSRRRVDAERGFLAELGGDCTLPAGAHAVLDDSGNIALSGLIASPDGETVLRHRVDAAAGLTDVATAGRDLARHLLDHGGNELLGRSPE